MVYKVYDAQEFLVYTCNTRGITDIKITTMLKKVVSCLNRHSTDVSS